jgi:DNA-binding HxlR family transcriptional regulator
VTTYDQFCALARATEIIGERWTLLIFRELSLGPRRYSDLLGRLSPIVPGVLSGRLKELEALGLIQRTLVAPPTPARLFELTAAGRALEPALHELVRWGARFLYPRRPGERFEGEWLRMVLDVYARPGPHPQLTVVFVVTGEDRPHEIWLRTGRDGITHIEPQPSADLRIQAPVSSLLGFIAGRLSIEGLADPARSATVSGAQGAAAAFAGVFGAVPPVSPISQPAPGNPPPRL